MNRYSFIIPCLFLMNFLSACSVTEQKALLNPDLLVIENNIGNGKEIGVEVVDERPEDTLGYRGAANFRGAAITTDQDVKDVFDRKIREGLKRKGFNPTLRTEEALRSLRVEIRSLEYYTTSGFWTGRVHTKTALKAIAKNAGKKYEQFYRGGNEEPMLVVPFAEENEKLINTAISEVLLSLFSDKKLFQFLSN